MSERANRWAVPQPMLNERKSAQLSAERTLILPGNRFQTRTLICSRFVLLAVITLSLVHSFTLSLFAQSRTDGVGPGGRYYPVRDFHDDFQVYDADEKAYVPYIAEQHAGQTTLSAYVDLESNRHYSLLITSQRDGYLFINAALKRRLIANRWLVLNIDSLYRAYRQPEIFLTFYGSPGVDDKRLLIGYPKSATQRPVVLQDTNLSVLPRQQDLYNDFLSLGLLFLLATHAFLFTFYHRAFLRFYSLRDLLSLRAQEESFLINRPMSSTNVLFLLNLGFVVGYLIMFMQSRNLDVFASRSLLSDQRFGWLVGEYLLVSAFAFLTLIGKYVVLEVIGGLYKLQRIINIHFFKILQSSLLFFTFLTMLLAIIAYNIAYFPGLQNVLLLPLIAFYTARLALLYLSIRSLEPIKNLYLFSYLCIVELVPLIIGLRFAL